MKYTEIKKDIFTINKSWYLAHCIASDLRMFTVMAIRFQKKFNLKEKIRKSGRRKKHPTCILTGRVFNLITKKKSSEKPTIYSMEKAINNMMYVALKNKVTKIAIPKAGISLDGLSWTLIRKMICSVFMDTHVHIMVCIFKGKLNVRRKRKS